MSHLLDVNLLTACAWQSHDRYREVSGRSDITRGDSIEEVLREFRILSGTIYWPVWSC